MEGLCRLCAVSRKDSVPTVIEDENSEICQQLRTVCQVDIRLSDPLPKLVCGECVGMMEMLFMFYTKVRRSQSTLRALLAGSKSDFTHPEIHPRRSSVQKPTSVLQMKDGEEFEDRIRNEADVDVEFENADVKQEAEDFFYVNIDSMEDTFFYESNDNIGRRKLTANPLRLSIVQEGSAIFIREEVEQDEKMVKTELDVNAEHSDLDEEAQESLDLNSGNETNTDMSGNYSDISNCNALRKFSKRLPIDDKASSAPSSHLKRRSKTTSTKSKRHYKCSICESAFTRQSGLKKHMTRHSGDRPYKCSLCKSTFTQHSHLKTHVLRHTGGRPYKCSICESAFTRGSHLKTHLLRHTGDRPYKCSFCDSTFTRRFLLKIHVRQHTGDRPYKCTVCDRAFAGQKNLKFHMWQHTGERPFKCSICDRTFTQQVHFKAHMRQHTGERPYKCSICDRGFVRRHTLKIHMRQHTGERPYKCSICERAFAVSGNLSRHMMSHTKGPKM